MSRPLKLSIIIPAYNEEGSIANIVHRIKNIKFPIEYEIIIVNDGSTDGTYNIVKKLSRDGKKRIKIISNRVRQGKGTSIRLGLKLAKGDIVVIQDADLEYDPKEIPRLLKPILDGKADVVFGSRFLNRHWPENMAFANYLVNRMLTLTANLLYKMKITDEATGYKLFRTKTIRSMRLKCKRFEFCPEVTAKAGRMKVKIVELPISYHGRTNAEGKKINWKDAIEAFWTLLKYRIIK